MNNYKDAIEKVLKEEGGYVKDPVDRGGETFRGISRKFFPKWEGWEIVDIDYFDDRLDELVVGFYRDYFWKPIHLDKVEDEFVASMLLNVAVNQGKRSVVKKIQRILGVKVDGIIGPVTLQALNDSNRDAFVYQFILETIDLYTHLITTDKRQKRFIAGWLARAMRLYHEYEIYKK